MGSLVALAPRDDGLKERLEPLSRAVLEALQELFVRSELREAAEDELHRLNLVDGREGPAENRFTRFITCRLKYSRVR